MKICGQHDDATLELGPFQLLIQCGECGHIRGIGVPDWVPCAKCGSQAHKQVVGRWCWVQTHGWFRKRRGRRFWVPRGSDPEAVVSAQEAGDADPR